MKVFIDVGAHIGESADFWLKHYPDWKVICWEPFMKNVHQIKQKGYEVIPALAWWKDDVIPFYFGLPQSGSVFSTKKTGGVNPNNFRLKPAFDFSRWLKEHYTKKDTIVVKMNCEGAEYSIIAKMEEDGTLDMVDKWYVQWHWDKIGLDKALHKKVQKMIKWSPWHAMTPMIFEKTFDKL